MPCKVCVGSAGGGTGSCNCHGGCSAACSNNGSYNYASPRRSFGQLNGCSCGSDCAISCSSCAGRNPSGYSSGDGGGGCSCGGDCSGGCSGKCKSTCKTYCDTGCKTEEAVDLYKKLKQGLNKKIKATDMNNINRMIQLEAKRRGKESSITLQTFREKEKANPDKIKKLQSNLKVINFEANKEANQKDKIYKNVGQELIDQSLRAYETLIKHD